MTPTIASAAAQPASSGPKWIGGNMPVARLGLILNLLVPLIFLIADALNGQLGADPVKEAIHTTGLVAVTFLVASLAITPVKLLTNWGWLIQFRRSVGVFAFYYACAHLAIYFWWDRERSLASTVYEITHRYYLLIGFLSLVLMLPLWATSFNGAIKALGGKRWKQLHRLTYVAAGLACLHFYLQTKADKSRPDIYIAILLALLLRRVIAYAAQRKLPKKAASD
jgi:DMSO/TMAO reductase YedYZ heme-binding membrane subunit